MVTILEFGPVPTPICQKCQKYIVFTSPEDVKKVTDKKFMYRVVCPQCHKVIYFNDNYGIPIPKAFKEKIQ